ncbi:PREDICTED: nitric oxide-associated protein 1 isoform X2 [Eufriesea mexicana]|uniref:nitric oxide-associated protein 1 isoform X2 n=1 Tax=Eufriesea mexicana TaxID=516756 RepID=UPI00083BB1C6|nr:PREDICTED: nitric oxide-associated protein 1 isoform X2 [Eufriesea mexicana]
MQILNIKFLLLQLRNHGANLNLKLRQFARIAYHRNDEVKPNPKVLALREKLVYCDYLDYERVQIGQKYMQMKRLKLANEKCEEYQQIAHEPVFSVMLNDREKDKNEDDSLIEKEHDIDEEQILKKQKALHMPYAVIHSYERTDLKPDDVVPSGVDLLNERYKKLYEKYLELEKHDLNDKNGKHRLKFEEFVKANKKYIPKGEVWKVPHTWMTDYEQFDDTLIDVYSYKNYGTADPNSDVTSIPCGGCGALLHCKDPEIPGYLPLELLSPQDSEELKSMICQRCHFLKFYNAALEVKVSIEDYPKLLKVIKNKKCAIILIIDLTDFPCSIWPDLKTIIHPFTPIFLVGNKVDLLPRDSKLFFENVKQLLLDTVIDVTGVKRENITHVELISAKTGYGIEQLINKLQYKWQYRGDVYLVGCTNVGKSSLFNILLKSDYCKVQAVDLVQRATVSAWPGTTLNLLKFPILNPTDKKRWLRMVRLKNEQFYKNEETKLRNYQFKITKNIRYATLKGHVGTSFTGNALEDDCPDPFAERSSAFMSKKLVLDESKPEYKQSRWCYDTPGTIQTDQILNLLTTDELLLTLPQQIITPRTFLLKPEQTVFVAGMGRLDYLEGKRCTVFKSDQLPITICYTADANEVYDQLLETEAFVVPVNDPERLKLWPKLESKEVQVTGVNSPYSVADVVLSSIGWIAIKPNKTQIVSLRAWTPYGRGIYFRSPPLLKRSVCFHGTIIRGSPMFSLGRRVHVT